MQTFEEWYKPYKPLAGTRKAIGRAAWENQQKKIDALVTALKTMKCQYETTTIAGVVTRRHWVGCTKCKALKKAGAL